VQGYEKGRYEEAIQHFKQAVDRDPTLLAVIDWTQAYQPRMEEHAKLGLKPEERLEDKKVCAALKENNSVNIQEGIDNLTQALKLRPDYDDAMAYMNLMYRERADLQCDDPRRAARAADLKTADDWVDVTLAVKKAKAEKQPGSQGMDQK
jgi:tetratricopeptide (TPR) repeat protein